MYYQPTSIRLPKVLKDFLRRRAEIEDRKLSQMIVHILELYRASITSRKKPPVAAKEGE